MNPVYGLCYAMAVLVLFPSCGIVSQEDVEPIAEGSSYDLVSFATADGDASPAGGARIRITFRDDNRFEGKSFTSIQGHNNFWGRYEVSEDGSFSIEDARITERGEPVGSRTEEFWAALHLVYRYRLADDELRLFYGDSKVMILTDTTLPSG